ncbi:MAG TPA: WYL domain-containing protein [Candidatus Binatia bacterium]|nr:WYL domain-containing protein [Candidatus Binatia bacterium]
MSRNDQVIRQWFLLQKLGSGRGATLQELAATLPEDCSRHPRTIRRDLEALDAVPFPLLTERVGGQTRWRLMDGSRRVPALAFSPTELMALVFSRDLLKPLDGTYLKASLDSAFNKAAAAWVKDRQWHPSQKISAHKDGRPTMTLRVADTRELLGWILHFGSGVRVIRPQLLRDQVREEAQKIFQGV